MWASITAVAASTVLLLALGLASITNIPLGVEPSSPGRPAMEPGMPAIALGDAELPVADARPDIVMVLLDDLAYLPDDDVLVRLPAIRQLWLENGLRFTEMHNETPLCCPARANLLSGEHTLRHGIFENDGNALDQERTLAVALDAAGYHTVFVGKYLNRWRGTTTPPGWDRMAMARGAYRAAFWRDGVLTNYRPLHVDEANHIQFVEHIQHAPVDEPLFALASVRAPHVDQCVNDPDEEGPCYEPRVVEADIGALECQGIPDFRPPSYSLTRERGPDQPMPDWPDGWKLGGVCESLLVIDRMVADTVDAQRARQRPVWFILLSDNGMSWGQHGNPFKRVPWSTRMPYYMAGSGIPRGETDALLSILDVTATIADVAGADMPWSDGTSFLPVLDGSGDGRDEMLEVMPGSWAGIRTREWHYVRWDDGTRQLFAYREDPWHQHDVVIDEAGVAHELDARLTELLDASRPS
jgi:N-acetylglucosamine-6-sulfatase